MEQNIIIHGDGACRGNPGIGGWGAIINNNQISQEIYGCVPNTTNNRMELQAIIESLKILNTPHHIIVYTDSQYVQKGMSLWITKWKIKAWNNVKNPDLWQELDNLASKHHIIWKWVRGHSGDIMNERADKLANQAIDEYLNQQKTNNNQPELLLDKENTTKCNDISTNENTKSTIIYNQLSLFD